MKPTTSHVKYAIYHVNYATLTSNIKQTRIFFILDLFKTCTIVRRTWNLIVEHATIDVKYETCSTSREICNLSRKVRNFNVKHEMDENIREHSLFWFYPKHATSNVKHEIRTANMQQQTLNMQPAILHVKYVTYHVKFATSTSNMKRTRIFKNILYFDFIQNMQYLKSNMQTGLPTCNNGR